MNLHIKKAIVAGAASCAVLIPLTISQPAMAAEEAREAAVVAAIADSSDEKIAKVDAIIADLERAEATMSNEVKTQTDYGKEIRNLLSTAWELRGAITDIATGHIPAFDVDTVLPRLELLTQISMTIKTSTTELTNKVNDAHVQLGFAVTRAVIRLINPSATVEQLKASCEDLSQTLERVKGYPDLSPNDTATIYVKARLDKVIWQTRFDRDKYILGKAPSQAYFELNSKITHAVGVWFNASATVAQVDEEIDHLQAAYGEALATVPHADEESVAA